MNKFLAELLCIRRSQSGAPWIRKIGNLSIQEISVVTPAYLRLFVHTSLQTLGKGSPKATRRKGGGGGRMSSFLGGNECHLFYETVV